jgi:hypothetical protein
MFVAFSHVLNLVFPKTAKTEPVEYDSGDREEKAFVEFLNKHAGTHRLPGGSLNADAGRVPALDELVKKIVATTSKSEEETIIDEVGHIVGKDATK